MMASEAIMSRVRGYNTGSGVSVMVFAVEVVHSTDPSKPGVPSGSDCA